MFVGVGGGGGVNAFVRGSARDQEYNLGLRHNLFPIVLTMALIEYCREIASFANTEVS